ncbi:peptidoglycan/xylan/chitin deacetylase (PgdA/CDA1 family) [Bacilli bacterium PM5-3]|nr:peptidoglycan/xylan/chitin deacetylase (PgdA/CDA1 family) [Bacilli bacterium PM5-3]
MKKKVIIVCIIYFSLIFFLSQIKFDNTTLIQKQIEFENNVSINNELLLFNKTINENSKKFSNDFIDIYSNQLLSKYSNSNLINKSEAFKLKLENIDDISFVKKIDKVIDINQKKQKEINNFKSLIYSFKKYKGNDEKANFVQIQYIINDYRKRNNYSKSMVVNNIENEKIKLAYLTFDDGPSANTKKIVDILNKNNLKGTFFFVGLEMNKKKNENVIRYVIENNQVIGMHGYSHDYVKTRKRDKFKKELFNMKNILKNKYNYTTNLVRSPYGSFTLKNKDIKYYLENGYYLWDWNVDTLDWEDKRKPNKVKNKTRKQIINIKKKKDIVVLYHEYPSALDSLQSTIDLLKQNNYHIINMNPEIFYSNYFNDIVE